MGRQRWTSEQKTEALELIVEHGPAEAARRTGIPVGTIASWATRAGVSGEHHTEATIAATAARQATTAERRAAMLPALLDSFERLAADLFAPTVEKRAVAAGQMREVEIVTIRHATTTATERWATVRAMALIVDKVQLIAGEATERIDLTGDAAKERALALVHDLRQRQAS